MHVLQKWNTGMDDVMIQSKEFDAINMTLKFWIKVEIEQSRKYQNIDNNY